MKNIGRVVKVTANQIAINSYTCPLTNINFIGSCINISCPANVSERRQNKSGCHFETKLDNLIGVAQSLKLSTHEVKRRYNKGMKKLSNFTSFYNWLQNHRELDNKKYCRNCGIINKTGLNCLNVKRCEQRQNLFKKRVVKLFPFNIPPLQITMAEFWATFFHPTQKNLIPKKLQKSAEKLIEFLSDN